MSTGENSTPDAPAAAGGPPAALFALAWLWVGAPMAYGLYELLLKAVQLFTGG
ncbi:hypothetical protein [Streptomyces sp. WMMB 322]|uniref:MFS transporter small subunit n=1 Tax=Streptomyces sp. WMMB 322 TaxID=1286821 RepID=UPI000823B5A1|nr:hypothetical protein [Streptomyces sp. WMMB 322]SCK35645.1 hypothetical protein H180DRAFT_02948 [Streptomyces sp. WMMB 322]